MFPQGKPLQLLYIFSLLLPLSFATPAAASSSPAVSISSPSSPLTSTASSQASCTSQSSTPVYIPIRNVSLSDQSVRRGVAISVGTPSQPFALLISSDLNNTFLQDIVTPSCNVNDTKLKCSSQFGGLFDDGSSTTWSPANFSALGTAVEDNSGQIDDLWGSDTILINTTLSIPKFPLGIFRGNQDPMNILGLGTNSTLLGSLVSMGAIASRSFGLFQGWTGVQSQHQADGGLTLGGYDAAKVTGNNITLPLTLQYNCNSGLVISVTDIKMNLRNGSNASIFGESQGSAMQACIQLDVTPLSLPEDIWWAFTNVTGTAETGRSVSPVGYWGMTIPSEGAYDGDLTISLYPGLDITIPNHQLVVPDIRLNDVGQEYLSNSTEVEVLINSLQAINKNDIPRFGMPFLTSAYLMVDNDHKMFTLWKSQQSKTSNLIPIGPPACNTPIPTPTPQAPSSALAPPPSNVPVSHESAHVSKGAIAGAIIGGLATIGLCVGAFLMRKRRRAQHWEEKQRQEYEARTEATKNSVYGDNATHLKPEMPSDKQPPQEMPLERDTGYSVAPYEMHNFETHEMPATPRLRKVNTPELASSRI